MKLKTIHTFLSGCLNGLYTVIPAAAVNPALSKKGASSGRSFLPSAVTTAVAGSYLLPSLAHFVSINNYHKNAL